MPKKENCKWGERKKFCKKNFENFEWEIIANILANEATVEEKQIFDKWISSNNENQAHFNDLKKIWDQSGKLSEYDLINVDAARKKV
ncbi:hypothetical protein KAI54_02425, partial [Candidatus Gracilibacteria bacterium]|nr:hypothetical protein [Candidatus Gracilibacteria bacterium]